MNIVIIKDYKNDKSCNKILGKQIINYIYDAIFDCDIFDHIISENEFNVSYVNTKGITLIIPSILPLITKNTINSIVESHKKNHNSISIYRSFTFGKPIDIFCINNKTICEQFDSIIQLIGNTGIRKLNQNSVLKIIDNDLDLFSVSNIYELSIAEKEISRRINLKHMMNGVYLMNPDTIVISPDAKIGSGTTIYPGCMIMGNTKIGKNCVIGPYTETMNAVFEDNVTCKQSVVYDSKILSGATVGPFTHLRMNSIVGVNDRIGNFVEMKNSTLGEKTNVAHLTYIGDTTCGSHVNWGCGTVTVNYDGKNKHKTIIGDNVFIGCNTNLIAPIKVASDSFIAAGSTVTIDTECGDFVIARVKPIVKKGYSYKYIKK